MKQFIIYIIKYLLLFGVNCYFISSFDLDSRQITSLSLIITTIIIYLDDIRTELKKINKNK